MIGYINGLLDDSQSVLITLEIPDDAITNINRPNIKFNDFATHYCNKAKVIDITDSNNNKLEKCNRYVFIKHPDTYSINEYIETDYNGSSIECKKLIQFNLSKEPLKLIMDNNREGIYYLYNKDGSVERTSEYKNNKLNGKTIIFKERDCYIEQIYNDDEIVETLFYNENNELFNGIHSEYYPNGELACKKKFINGKLNDTTYYYGLNGDIIAKMNYKDNELVDKVIEY